jgi:hypothetical protein
MSFCSNKKRRVNLFNQSLTSLYFRPCHFVNFQPMPTTLAGTVSLHSLALEAWPVGAPLVLVTCVCKELMSRFRA